MLCLNCSFFPSCFASMIPSVTQVYLQCWKWTWFVLHSKACLIQLHYGLLREIYKSPVPFSPLSDVLEKVKTQIKMILFLSFFKCPICSGCKWLAAHSMELLAGMWEWGYQGLNVELNPCGHLQFQRQWLWQIEELKYELHCIIMVIVLKRHLFKIKFDIISINYRSS